MPPIQPLRSQPPSELCLESLSRAHSTVHAPPSMQRVITPTNATICGREPSTAFHPGVATLFASAGNVVAKTSVGFGEPDTVTVTADAIGDEALEESAIEKRGERPNIWPMVEFRNNR